MSHSCDIIIAVLNGVKTIDAAVLSVLRQKNVDRRVSVIDGGSTDGTIERLQRYESDLFRLVSEPDSGIAEAWNKALTFSTAQWVGFIGSDDRFLDARALSKLITHSEANPMRPDVVHSYVRLSGPGPDKSLLGELPGKLHRRMSYPHVGALHNRNLFEKFGVFDTSFKIAVDYEFALRKEDLAVCAYPEVLIEMGSGGLSNRRQKVALRENRAAQIKHKVASRASIEALYFYYRVQAVATQALGALR